MKYKETLLLCTFTDKKNLSTTLKSIFDYYNVNNNKIIILYNKNNSRELFCLYNCFDFGDSEHLDRTISLHRKKESNTLYTINSLNKLIWKLNNGNIDPKFLINWKDYYNTLLLVKDDDLVEIKTQLLLVYYGSKNDEKQ